MDAESVALIQPPDQNFSGFPELAPSQPLTAPFTKVKDSRGNPIRGLWQRNDRFYAQLRLPGKKSSSKVPLVDPSGFPLRTVARARAALHDLLAKRQAGSLAVLSRTPTLSEYIDTYLHWLRRAQTKSPLTIAKEAGALANWTERLGGIRLAHFSRAHINEFIAWRKETGGVSNRTINLDVLVLNNCLRHARDEGKISLLPTENWRPLEHVSPSRPLWSEQQIVLVCQKATEAGKNGGLLADYILFLAYSGARRNEALAVEWEHINWDRRFVTLCKTKYGRPRSVDFNANLEAHLKSMRSRRVPGAKFLFPSPRGDGEAVRNLQASLETAREAAGLPEFRFHDLRSYFISYCVMAGVDYLTIARWVGHRDGGVLIGRVYGHVNDDHAKKMAARVFAAKNQPAGNSEN